MLASAEQKASYKKAMIPYLLGAIFVSLIAGFAGIPGVVFLVLFKLIF